MAVHQGLGKADFVEGDTNPNKPARVGDEVISLTHGNIAARCIDNDMGEITIGHFFEGVEFLAFAFDEDGIFNAHGITDKSEALFVGIHDDGSGACDFHKLKRG